MAKAEIAKKLVTRNPALLLPTNKDQLCEEINLIYSREVVGVPF